MNIADPDNPEQKIRKRYAWWPWKFMRPRDGQRKLWWPHHAAVFASTRWTNLYFPAGLGLFGDLIGGRLAPVFGHGIRDVPVTWGRGVRARTPAIHTHYWTVPGSGSRQALDDLRHALDLQCERTKPELRGR